MIVDDLRLEERDGMIERSARVRWRDGAREERLSFSAPPEMSRREEDASPFLTACLLLAMRHREDLEVDGAVSPWLLEGCEAAQTIYGCWAPQLRRAGVRVAGVAGAAAHGTGLGCFFSRGVDSMYSAAAEKRGELTHLVFVVDLDPINDEATRAREVELAEEAAGRLGLPLVLVRSDIRPVSGKTLDWADLVGAGLAAMAQCLDGGLGHVLVPSSQDWATMGPCGSSPVLDHLFSTESMRIEHGEMGEGRHGKVAWLARHRPDLLPLLKVCYQESRPDNCGRCLKCLWTMVCLEAVGSLEAATSFPPAIDVQLIRRMRLGNLAPRLFMLHAADALRAAGRAPELEQAVRESLRRSARPSVLERARRTAARVRGRPPTHDPGRSRSRILFYREQTNAALAVLRGGAWPPGSGGRA